MMMQERKGFIIVLWSDGNVLLFRYQYSGLAFGCNDGYVHAAGTFGNIVSRVVFSQGWLLAWKQSDDFMEFGWLKCWLKIIVCFL